ncbi:MAG: ion transporter [Verrucomicrobiota bacterium]
MSEQDLQRLLADQKVAPWRMALARWVESPRIQRIIIGLILINAAVLGMETNAALMEEYGTLLVAIDKICLVGFVIEIALKLAAYRLLFWRSGWNWFDFIVVGIALIPAAGPWAILRALRVLRVLRLLTVVPALRKVVAAFLHAIPGLAGVIAVMSIFFYTAAVLATRLFGEVFPEWFGHLGASLFSLFQIMTLESWSMGIVRPVMVEYPWAWAFFVPFIIIATFTILNLFIGIIVSTMQELSEKPELEAAEAAGGADTPEIAATLRRLEREIRELRQRLEKNPPA